MALYSVHILTGLQNRRVKLYDQAQQPLTETQKCKSSIIASEAATNPKTELHSQIHKYPSLPAILLTMLSRYYSYCAISSI